MNHSCHITEEIDNLVFDGLVTESKNTLTDSGFELLQTLKSGLYYDIESVAGYPLTPSCELNLTRFLDELSFNYPYILVLLLNDYFFPGTPLFVQAFEAASGESYDPTEPGTAW